MSTAVVWLTKGGIVECVASLGTDVVIIDFMNLQAGDGAPALSEAHKALLRDSAPSVLDDLKKYEGQSISPGDQDKVWALPDLPGYIFVSGGVLDHGCYVLPPGGSALNDRDYLGFYQDKDAAVEAARQHMANPTPFVILQQLSQGGWTQQQKRTFVSRMVDTAVGPKQASLWFYKGHEEGRYWLTGRYDSERSNALEPAMCEIPAGVRTSVVRALVDDFLVEVNRRIEQTYAVKLHAQGVRPEVRPNATRNGFGMSGETCDRSEDAAGA